MVIINTVNDRYFSLNGINYAKIYQPLKQGDESIGIYNVFDTRQQLVNSTHYSEITINGSVPTSQVNAISALLSVINDIGGSGKNKETVNTLTELKEKQGDEDSYIIMLGYYTKGDGGGGVFKWDSESEETDNGGTVIDTTSIGVGRWKRIYQGFASVRFFGVKADGVADDADGINRAIKFSKDNNIFVNFDGVECGFENKILISSNCKIINANLKSLSSYKDSLNFSSIIDIEGTGIIIKNSIFNMNNVNNFGVRVKELSSYVNFENVEIKNIKEIDGITGTKTCAIQVDSGVSNFTYDHGVIRNVTPIENETSGDAQGAGRGILIGEVSKTLIKNIKLIEIKGFEDGDCIHVQTSLNGGVWSNSDVEIRECTMHDIYKSGIKLQASGVRVMSNIINSNVDYESEKTTVAGIRDYGTGNIVEGNEVAIKEGTACIIVGAQGVIEGNIYKNNLLTINKEGLSKFTSTPHIRFDERIKKIQVTNNVLKGFGGVRFSVTQKVEECIFDNNTLYDSNIQIYYTPDATRYVNNTSISNNRFIQTEGIQPASDVYVSNPNGVIIHGNYSIKSNRLVSVLDTVGSEGVEISQFLNIDFKGTSEISLNGVSNGAENVKIFKNEIYRKFIATTLIDGVDVEEELSLNVDNINTSCVVYSGSLTGTLPTGVNSGYIQTFTYINSAIQFIYRHNLGALNDFYFRGLSAGVWSEWKKANADGHSGSFTTQDAKTVTVEKGLIISIV